MAGKVKELSEAELAAVMAAILQITRSKSLTEFETKHLSGMKPMPSRGLRGKAMRSQYFVRFRCEGRTSGRMARVPVRL